MRTKTIPKWVKEIEDMYKSGMSNAFILTGNVNDYVVPGERFNEYLYNFFEQMGFAQIDYYDVSLSGQLWNILKPKMINTQNNEKRALIIEYPEYMVPNVPEFRTVEERGHFIELHKLINDVNFITSENIIIFVTESARDINSRFLSSSSKMSLIEIGLPDISERLEMLEYLKETEQREFKKEITTQEFANLTAGLTRFNIEDIYLQAEMTGVLTKDSVTKRKNAMMLKEYGDVIELFDTGDLTLRDFFGQDSIKDYHKEVVVRGMVERDRDLVPNGLLYFGAPGTGKTYFAKCVAGEAGITAVQFNISKLLDKYVGESEKRLAKMFTCLEALYPVIVFVDEIDQAFSRGENDSNSVNKNIFGMFLQFLSDPKHKGNILWIGAANYPNNIDEALKRPGRFDKKIPFLPPINASERADILMSSIRKSKLSVKFSEAELYFAIKDLEGYTPAEIENIALKMIELAKRKKLSYIDFEMLSFAKGAIGSKKNDKIKEMTRLAIEECDDLEFLPKEYRK